MRRCLPGHQTFSALGLPFLIIISWDLKSRIITVNIPAVEILYKVEAVFLVVQVTAACGAAHQGIKLFQHLCWLSSLLFPGI
jgi:hypothetical protein